MAKTVYTAEEYELADGQKIVLKPLVLSVLKKAMTALEEVPEEDNENPLAGLDYILGVAEICLQGQLPADYPLEDNIDLPTAKRVVAVSTGIDLDSSNLMMEAAAQVGQN